MTFSIKNIVTKHVLTHGKDFALVELEFNGEPSQYFKPEKHRYGTIEYGTKQECLAGLATGATIAEALKNREDLEDMVELVERFGGADKAMTNPQFKVELDRLMARA